QLHHRTGPQRRRRHPPDLSRCTLYKEPGKGGALVRLEGKVAVITGAGAGLGRESALLFAREGASVVVTDVDGGRAEDAARLVDEQGGAALALKTDVTNEAEVRDAVQAAVDTFGKLDIMFNNAGITVPGFGLTPFEELTEAD